MKSVIEGEIGAGSLRSGRTIEQAACSPGRLRGNYAGVISRARERNQGSGRPGKAGPNLRLRVASGVIAYAAPISMQGGGDNPAGKEKGEHPFLLFWTSTVPKTNWCHHPHG